MNYIELAKQAGLHIATDVNWMPIISLEYAEKFANLVAAAVTEKHITAIQNIERKGGWITREDAIEAIKGTT
jgi:hypothetical protein